MTALLPAIFITLETSPAVLCSALGWIREKGNMTGKKRQNSKRNGKKLRQPRQKLWQMHLKKTKLNLRSFVEQALKEGADPSAAAAAAQKMGDTQESFSYLSDLLGLDPKELERNPDLAKSFIFRFVKKRGFHHQKLRHC